MNSKAMEKTSVAIFILGVIVFSVIIIGLFLLILKISLLFSEQVQIMGLLITPAP